MDRKFSVARSILLLLAFGMVITSCKKLGRPALGDYPTDDQQLPGGDLQVRRDLAPAVGPAN